ncbi:MAG TPA: NirA family protein [Tepidisphaeraceae bacterium]|jgi:ferredoxin-nitrite reductase|nr:NirA family protein [Tepidisphaeraceae bacterium]
MDGQKFTEEQKQYLQGFAAGSGLAQATFAATLGLKPEQLPGGPEALHFRAQDRIVAEGGKLCPEEQAKRTRFPLDIWDEIRQHQAENRPPQGTDVLAFKYHGLFWVAPAQDSFMCRLRFPGGIVTSHQLRGVADLAEQFGGGYADVTTRANLQIRQIKPSDTTSVIQGLHDLGIINRGAGADNIRNITASPTAGIDPRELIDTRPLAKELHHFILNHRELYGLPRKFNIAFDGGGAISALEDTNDIGFTALRVSDDQPLPAGVYFRLALGGITGHKDFAHDSGILLKPEECVPVAYAVLRVFIDHGDRTDRKKARLKYLLDRWGHEKFLAEVQKLLAFPLRRLELSSCEARPQINKHGHIGFHPQKQEGLCYVGVVLPVARMRCDQMRGLARLADQYGSGTIRLTVWQNLLISDIPLDKVDVVKRELGELGLAWSASHIRGGLVACTGNVGCRFSAADTKRHGLRLGEYLDSRIELDQPINIHLTGCPHSCAQHFIGDIGLLGAKVGDDMVEGYHIFVGGGYGVHQDIGRQLYASIPAEDVPPLIERILRAYLESRIGPQETFGQFTKRFETDQLKELFEQNREALKVAV